MIKVDVAKAQLVHFKVLERLVAGEIDLAHYEAFSTASREELDKLLAKKPAVVGNPFFDPAEAELTGGPSFD